MCQVFFLYELLFVLSYLVLSLFYCNTDLSAGLYHMAAVGRVRFVFAALNNSDVIVRAWQMCVLLSPRLDKKCLFDKQDIALFM